MKRLCLTVGMITAAFSMGLQAQVLDARVKVPFDFWLGQKLMPAGEYSIYHMAIGAVLIQGGDRHPTSAAFISKPLSRPTTRSEGKLEFNRYGNTYFLSKIWNPNEKDGHGVPRSPREKEVASHTAPSETKGIALLTK